MSCWIRPATLEGLSTSIRIPAMAGLNSTPAHSWWRRPECSGNAPRRSFYGPGILNFDVELGKNVPITESKSLDFRIEAFNVFNHAQFYGHFIGGWRSERPEFQEGRQCGSPASLRVAFKLHF